MHCSGLIIVGFVIPTEEEHDNIGNPEIVFHDSIGSREITHEIVNDKWRLLNNERNTLYKIDLSILSGDLLTLLSDADTVEVDISIDALFDSLHLNRKIDSPILEERKSISFYKHYKLEYDKPECLYTFYFYRHELEDIAININFIDGFQEIYGCPFELRITPSYKDSFEPNTMLPLFNIVADILDVICVLIVLSLIVIEIVHNKRTNRSC